LARLDPNFLPHSVVLVSHFFIGGTG